MNALVSSLVNAAILSLPLTASVWLASRLLPRRSLSAAARYCVWWVALIGVVLLPLAYLPRSAVPAPMTQIVRTVPGEFSVATAKPGIARASASPRSMSSLRFPIRIATGPWTRWLFVAWAVAAFLMLVRLLAGCRTLLRLKAGSQPAWIAVAVRRNARLMLSREISAPMAVGFLKPAILLPARCADELSSAELKQIALHESAHLNRWDDYALICQRALEAVFVLYPTVHFIARQLDLEREIACDDCVLQVTGQAKSYAACLTRVAEMSGRISFAAAAFSQDRSQLSRRVDMLLDQTRNTRAGLLKTRLALAAAILMSLAWTLTKTPTLLAFSAPVPTRHVYSTSVAKPFPQAPVLLSAPAAATSVAPKLIAQAPALPTARPTTNQPNNAITLPVGVRTPDGQFVAGLTRDDFKVFENGVAQTISYFGFDDTPPAIEVMLTDGSSVNQETHDALKEVTDAGGTVTYSGPPRKSMFATDIDAVESRIEKLPNSRKVILVVGGSEAYFSPEFAAFLADRAEFTGVSIVSATKGQLDSDPFTVRRLIDPTRYYTIRYTPSNFTADGSYRGIRVEVKVPGVKVIVRSRTGYYATAP